MKIEELLNKTSIIIPKKIVAAGGKPESLTPSDVEKITHAVIQEVIPSVLPNAKATLISGQKFPDITISLGNKVEGVEVKSTRSGKNPWTVTGGSIREGNRIESVADVGVVFTKLAGKVETKTRPYEEAVCDLAVTHSPRYILSMESPKEKSLFAKLGISYQDVRNSESPFEFFRNYLEAKAKECGGQPWWSNQESEVTSPPLIRFWGDLNGLDKDRLLIEGYSLFAGDFLFGQKKVKYRNFSMHLMRKHSIICTSVRDRFSASGKKVIFKKFGRTPAVFKRFHELLGEIKAAVLELSGDNNSAWSEWKKNILALSKTHENGDYFELFKRIFKDYK